MTVRTPTYSFVVPIYEDGYLVQSFCEAMQAAMIDILGTEDHLAHELELIFVNDGSRNNSQQLLVEASRKFPFVKVIELSRNFGQHVAVSCGYRFAKGKFVGMLNADQQDPPDQVGVVLAALRAGDFDIAIGLRRGRGETLMNTVTSRLFHTSLNLLTGSNTPIDSATLRIMTRRFVDAYNSLSEKTPYIPGLENWLGFRHTYVPVRHQQRTHGKSSYNFRKRWRMAVESIIGFSDLPMRFAATLGFLITCVGMLLNLILIVKSLFFANYLPGYTSTVSLVVFLGGLNLMFLGLVSLYVGRILREVQGRPSFIVKSYERIPLTDSLSRESATEMQRLIGALPGSDKTDVLEKVAGDR